jgi:hypothetical protein
LRVRCEAVSEGESFVVDTLCLEPLAEPDVRDVYEEPVAERGDADLKGNR